MNKDKTIKEIVALSDKILKTGDEESVIAANAMKFVVMFLARGYIGLLMMFFGNLAQLMKWTEDDAKGKTPSDNRLVLPPPDIVQPN